MSEAEYQMPWRLLCGRSSGTAELPAAYPAAGLSEPGGDSRPAAGYAAGSGPLNTLILISILLLSIKVDFHRGIQL